MSKELREQTNKQIIISLLNNVNNNTKRVYCDKHITEKANIIENNLFKYAKKQEHYTDIRVIEYISSCILPRTEECNII